MPTIASLFSGGGLVECGASTAGYQPIWGVEFDVDNVKLSSAIADNYELNFDAHIQRMPVESVDWTTLEPPDLLWASPVCKQFSSANQGSVEEHGDIDAAMGVQRALEVLRPTVFCLENVRAYQRSQSFQLIRDTLNRLGYGISEQVLNCADYGVPQTRNRLFLRAVLHQFPPSLPPPVHARSHIGWLGAMIDLLPLLPESRLASWQEQRLSELELDGSPILVERSGARSDRPLLVRTGEQPCWTLRASTGTDQNGSNRNDAINAIVDGRVLRLTPRALARLQTVSDWYVLPEEMRVAGPLLGNGVPSLMAQVILEGLRPYANTSKKLMARDLQYATIGKDFPDGLLATTTGKSESNVNLPHSPDMDNFNIAVDLDERDHDSVDSLILNDVPIGTTFNVEVLSSDPMTQAEAKACIEEINVYCTRIRQRLVDIEDRQGYAALGFKNMNQLLKSGYFSKARSTLQKELQAGRIETHHLGVPAGTFLEGQIRPLSKLDPSYYKPAIEKATQLAGDIPLTSKHISAAVAEMIRENPATQKKGVVEKIKEKEFTKASDSFVVGDVFVLTGSVEGSRKYDGCWAIAEAVNEFTLVVFTYNGAMTVKPDNLTPIDSLEEQTTVSDLASRIKKLRDCGLLDRTAYAVLESLGRQSYLSEVEAGLLAWLENHYRVGNGS